MRSRTAETTMLTLPKRLRAMSIAILAVMTLASLTSGVSAETGEDPARDNSVVNNTTGNANAVILYYFHGTRRCNTCRSIEAYAQEAVEGKFKDALRAGTLKWTVLNTDESENAHFAKDFGLVSSSLVLAQMNGEEVTRYEVLQDAWTLVRDKPRFIAYVQKAVGECLE
jgi:hypothetical protein